MTIEETQSIRELIQLFGLADDFSMEDLGAAYHTLAKLYHPDRFQGRIGPERMAMVNDAFHRLREYRRGHERSSLSGSAGQADDIFYAQYKRAFTQMREAFDDYFDQKASPDGADKYQRLRERLIRAREAFSVLVNDLPYSRWVDDAIDKISSINIWLR